MSRTKDLCMSSQKSTQEALYSAFLHTPTPFIKIIKIIKRWQDRQLLRRTQINDFTNVSSQSRTRELNHDSNYVCKAFCVSEGLRISPKALFWTSQFKHLKVTE